MSVDYNKDKRTINAQSRVMKAMGLTINILCEKLGITEDDYYIIYRDVIMKMDTEEGELSDG